MGGNKIEDIYKIYNKDYKIYNSIGSTGSKYANYIQWKTMIVDRYSQTTNIDYFENLLRYLNKIKRFWEFSLEMRKSIIAQLIALIISLLVIIPSMTIANSQYSDTILGDMGSNSKSSGEFVLSIKERIKLAKKTSNGIYIMLIELFVGSIIIYGLLYVISFISARKVYFYMDYMEIVDGLKNDLLKSNKLLQT